MGSVRDFTEKAALSGSVFLLHVYFTSCLASKPSADIVQLKSRQNDLIWHVDICAFGEKCKLLCKDVVVSYLSEKSGRLLPSLKS